MIQHFGQPPRLANGTTVPLTPAVRAGNLLFLSGQLGLDESGRLVSGGIHAETARCLDRIAAVLKDTGLGLDSIVKTTVFLARAEDFAAFNSAYAAYFGESPPARSTVLCGLLIPGAAIEIEVVAAIV